jgi:hypothetical protein
MPITAMTMSISTMVKARRSWRTRVIIRSEGIG